MKTTWLHRKTSLYGSHTDNIGRPATYKDILFSEYLTDLETIDALRRLDKLDPNYVAAKRNLKAKLQCYTPAGLLRSKAKGAAGLIERTGVMQLDFDYEGIKDYDLEELKVCLFRMPFICLCSLSCSGDGFYALAVIAEPEKLFSYAEHCFHVLNDQYGIKADTSKGKKVENLRYLSHDVNMLVREEPEPLVIKHFKTKLAPQQTRRDNNTKLTINGEDRHLNEALHRLRSAPIGNRIATIQKVSYTLGGRCDLTYLNHIRQAIQCSSQYAEELSKYLKCAENCFYAGMANPL